MRDYTQRHSYNAILKPITDNAAAFRKGSLLRWSFVLCSLPFSATALAGGATLPEGTSYSLAASISTPTTSREHANAIPLANSFGVGVDGIDCITAYDAVAEEPLQVAECSSDLPNDPERGVSVLADKASIPSRPDQDPTQTAGGSFAAATLRLPGIAPVLLLPTHSSDFLHEHMRERAPPTLA